MAPLRMAGPAAKVAPKLGAMALARVGRMLGGELPEATKTRFNGKVSSQRVFDSAIFDFDKVRAIRAAAPGATVNDVVLAVIGGAMRRYLKARKELPKATLTAVSPVNTRPDKGATGTAGNNISAVTFPLRTSVKWSVIETRTFLLSKPTFGALEGHPSKTRLSTGANVVARTLTWLRNFRGLGPASRSHSGL